MDCKKLISGLLNDVCNCYYKQLLSFQQKIEYLEFQNNISKISISY